MCVFERGVATATAAAAVSQGRTTYAYLMSSCVYFTINLKLPHLHNFCVLRSFIPMNNNLPSVQVIHFTGYKDAACLILRHKIITVFISSYKIH